MPTIQIETGTPELLCELEHRVATVTLNKPHKKNALGDELTPALRRIISVLEDDSRVGCIMITGAGDAFCSGGDVSGMNAGASANSAIPSRTERIDELTHRQRTLTARLHHCSKITVAALPGPAAGAGLSIALACDFRLASDTAFVTTAFVNIGLSGDYGGSWFLQRLVGQARAREMYFLGERVDAATCLAMGLVNRVFPGDDFREEAFAFCRKIAAGPTEALGRMKQNINLGASQDLDASLILEARNMVDSQGPEAREAISAFLEKRSPVFHRVNNGQEPA